MKNKQIPHETFKNPIINKEKDKIVQQTDIYT
jgi:hypothetical protein